MRLARRNEGSLWAFCPFCAVFHRQHTWLKKYKLKGASAEEREENPYTGSTVWHFFLFVNEHSPLSLNLLTKNIYALVFFASFSVVFVVVVVSFFSFHSTYMKKVYFDRACRSTLPRVREIN